MIDFEFREWRMPRGRSSGIRKSGIRHLPVHPCPSSHGLGASGTLPDHMKQAGLFIVLEGIDGTGKSTQAQLLADWFRAQGREVVASREPTDGHRGRQIRATAASGRLAPEEELELFLKDRREHVEQLITPALADGKVVILDRCTSRPWPIRACAVSIRWKSAPGTGAFAPQPDLLLILDLDVDRALERIGARGDTANEFEKRDALARCREIFLS